MVILLILRVILFNLFHFTQGKTNFTVYQVICIINNCTYTLFVFIHTIHDYYRLPHYACPAEIGKELAISHVLEIIEKTI